MGRRPSDSVSASPVRDLARLGAGRAARALGRLLGRELRAGEPEPRGARGSGVAVTGIVFELEGDLAGLVALLLPESARLGALRTLCPGADPEGDRAASALREVGNIVASQAVSAVADFLGKRITISVPTLVSGDAGAILGRMIARRGGVAAASELHDDQGRPGGCVVFAPDGPASF